MRGFYLIVVAWAFALIFIAVRFHDSAAGGDKALAMEYWRAN
jgi:hypothetical protein